MKSLTAFALVFLFSASSWAANSYTGNLTLNGGQAGLSINNVQLKSGKIQVDVQQSGFFVVKSKLVLKSLVDGASATIDLGTQSPTDFTLYAKDSGLTYTLEGKLNETVAQDKDFTVPGDCYYDPATITAADGTKILMCVSNVTSANIRAGNPKSRIFPPSETGFDKKLQCLGSASEEFIDYLHTFSYTIKLADPNNAATVLGTIQLDVPVQKSETSKGFVDSCG